MLIYRLVYPLGIVLMTWNCRLWSQETKEYTEFPLPKERIEELVQAIDHEDVEAREEASEKLLWSCRPALEAAQKVLEAPPSLEARIRAERIAKTIRQRVRRETYKGGEVVRGLQATLRSEKDIFGTGETLAFELEVKNVSELTVAFRGIDSRSFHGGFDYELPDRDGPENWDNPAKIVLQQRSGEKIKREGQMGGGCKRNLKVELAAGEHILYPIMLPQTDIKERRGTQLVPGDYELSIFFYGKTRSQTEKDLGIDRSLDPLTFPEDLKSNTIRFRVERAVKEQP